MCALSSALAQLPRASSSREARQFLALPLSARHASPRKQMLPCGLSYVGGVLTDYRKHLCFPQGGGLYFLENHLIAPGGNPTNPEGNVFILQNPGGHPPAGGRQSPPPQAHPSPSPWTKFTNKRSKRRGQEGRIRGHMHGVAFSCILWVHQEGSNRRVYPKPTFARSRGGKSKKPGGKYCFWLENHPLEGKTDISGFQAEKVVMGRGNQRGGGEQRYLRYYIRQLCSLRCGEAPMLHLPSLCKFSMTTAAFFFPATRKPSHISLSSLPLRENRSKSERAIFSASVLRESVDFMTP